MTNPETREWTRLRGGRGEVIRRLAWRSGFRYLDLCLFILSAAGGVGLGPGSGWRGFTIESEI